MDSLDDVLNFLGWTSESLDNISDTEKCSISSGHLIPKNRVDIHMEKCRMRQQGYTKEQINAFWRYSDEEIRMFSEAALQSSAARLPPDLIFDLSNTHLCQGRDSKKISDHEKAFIRDLKRRRQSYRGIHTARKPYIEILREVIEHQTALLSGSTSSNLDTNGSLQDKVKSSKYSNKRSRDGGTSFDDDRSSSKLQRSSDKHFRSSNPHSDSHSLSRHTHERHSRLPHPLSNDRVCYHLERSRSRKESNRRRY